MLMLIPAISHVKYPLSSHIILLNKILEAMPRLPTP